MFNRRQFLQLTGLTAAGLTGGCRPAAHLARPASACKPNFVIIFADDLGYGDLSVYGHPTLHTPSLDRMAAEGMKLTQFYSANPVCSPSRAALLTGRYPNRVGISEVFFPHHKTGLSQSEITIAGALKPAGYATAAVGKWHLGHTPGHLPTDHGFDSYFGIPYSNDMSVDPRMEVAPDAVFREGRTLETMRTEKPRRGKVPLLRNTQIIEYPADQHTLTRRYTEKAVEFIKDNKKRPFFLYLAHTFPHVPLYASTDFEGTSRRGLYGDVVEELDHSVGIILQTLKDSGLDGNTLVIFTSDNGPWLVKNLEGGSAGLLRGGKTTTWEGGMRQPCIARWPGRISAGSVSMEITATLDLFPTLLDLAGVNLPSDRPLDGASLRQVLTKNGKSPRIEMAYYLGLKLRAFRSGPWKLHLETAPETGGKYQIQDPPLLFNLETDPSEKHNIAADHPEIIAQILKQAQIQKEAF